MAWTDGDGLYMVTASKTKKGARKVTPGGPDQRAKRWEWGRVCPAEWVPEALGLEEHLTWSLMHVWLSRT